MVMRMKATVQLRHLYSILTQHRSSEQPGLFYSHIYHRLQQRTP